MTLRLSTFTPHRKPLLWASLFYLGLAVLFTWPLVLHMGDSVAGQIGDNVYFVWMIAWFKRALFELHVNPFNVWFLNYPEGWNMAYTEITPAMLALALPFSFIGGATFAYNAAMLLAFALSGITMFIWIRHLTGRNDAALVAGMIFACLPFRMAHYLIGHLNLSGTMWLPLFFMGFLDLLKMDWNDTQAKIPWRAILLTGISLGLIGLTSQYYLYMTIMVGAFLAFIYLVFYDRKQILHLRFWRALGLSGLVALPLVIIAVAPYFNLNRAGGLPNRNLSIVRMYSASPTDFILPSTQHFLWGQWVGQHFNREMWVEGTLYIGVITLLLAGIAFFKRKQISERKLVSVFIWGAAFAVLLAMGTDLHWLGQPVTLPAPGFVAKLIHRPEIPMLLPGYFLFQYFPFFAKLRALMRFGVFALLFFSALAGIGSAWLLQKFQIWNLHKLGLPDTVKRIARPHLFWQTAATAGLLLLVFLDFYPGPYRTFARVQARPVDYWLAQQPGTGAVIQFPFSKGEDQDQTYNTLVHQKPFVGGFFNAFPPAQYSKIKPIMENFPDAASVDLMRTLGVQYVLVSAKDYQEIELIRNTAIDLGLFYDTEIDGELVFLLNR